MKTLLCSVLSCVVIGVMTGCQTPLFTNSFGWSSDKERQVTATNNDASPLNRFGRPRPTDTRQNIVDQRLVVDYIQRGRQAMAANQLADQRGLQAMAAKQLADAELNFESALRLDRNNATAFQLLGQIGDLTGNFKDAEHYYLQALTQRPNDPDLLSDMGYSYMQQGRFREAKNKLFESLRLAPNHRMAKINIAAVFAYEGDQQKAMAYLRQVGTPQEAQQIMANLLKYPPRNRGSQTQLVNNTQDQNLSPALLDLQAQMEVARRETAERRRRRALQNDMEMRRRMNQAFGPTQNGRIDDGSINSRMSDIERQYQRDISQIPKDNRSGITRVDPNRNSNQFTDPRFTDTRPPALNGFNNQLRMADGRPAIIDANGVITPIGPVPNTNRNQIPEDWNPQQRTTDRGQPDTLRFPDSTGRVMPINPNFNRVNPMSPMLPGQNSQLNLNPVNPNLGFPRQPNGYDATGLPNTSVQNPGVWDQNSLGPGVVPADVNWTPADRQAPEMRAMRMGLAAGPGGMMPPDLMNVQRQPVGGGLNQVPINRSINQQGRVNADNVWRPQTQNAAPADEVSAFDRPSAQRQMTSENWRQMSTATRSQVPSPNWNYETQLPHQQAGPRTMLTPFSNGHTGPLASPTLHPDFAQPRITTRDQNANQDSVSRFKLGQQLPNSNTAGSRDTAFFNERFTNP
jgi:Flp pilus assembly protein TadD